MGTFLILERRAALAVVLFVVTALAHAGSCDSGFIDYDDNVYVTANPSVSTGLTPENVRWAWTTGRCANWHPLTWMSLQLDAQLRGLQPAQFHLTNVLLHSANVLLLFLILERMTGALWRSAFVAALFALHPLHVEPVAWVAERKGVLSTFFGLLALWFYALYANRQRLGYYGLVCAFFALSLLAKPMLVTLPFVLLLLDFWPLQRLPGTSFRRLLLEKVPLFGLALAFSVIAVFTQDRGGALRTFAQVPLGARVANALVCYVRYLGMAVWPANLVPFYPRPEQAIPIWQILGAACVLSLLTYLALRLARRSPYLLVGWLWYLGTLVPVIGILSIGLHGWADRYMYIPSVGLFLITSWGLGELVASSRTPQTAAVSGAALVLAALLVLTVRQSSYWHDPPSLWRHVLAVDPRNYMAHDKLGCDKMLQTRYIDAVDHFRKSVAESPGYANAHTNLGSALMAQGKYPEAIKEYEISLRIDPLQWSPRVYWAAILVRQGKAAEALPLLFKALELSPDSGDGHLAIAMVFADMGNWPEAKNHLAQATDVEPELLPVKAALEARLRDRN